MDECEPNNYCSDIDDYRPIQSTLLTRFTLADDCSDLWRTTNQDYGAFYYQNISQYCTPDSLKAKTHRRLNRFQDWMLYQTKCQKLLSPITRNFSTNNNNNNNNQTIRITHRKRFVPRCDNDQNRNTFSPCGEDGLITEHIVKKIMHQLQCLINPNEYHDVVQCAQMLTSEILSQEPSLCVNAIIDRVITIMITPPNTIPQTCTNPCPSLQSINDNNLMTKSIKINNDELPLSTSVTISKPFIEYNQSLPISNVFNKLTDLEDAISKISHQFVKA
ncbi:hypothetical protein I4U23_026288 [Adineta vaga]|nr:hypothetical protein I4U23_026288 [Adineta vaga]